MNMGQAICDDFRAPSELPAAPKQSFAHFNPPQFSAPKMPSCTSPPFFPQIKLYVSSMASSDYTLALGLFENGNAESSATCFLSQVLMFINFKRFRGALDR